MQIMRLIIAGQIDGKNAGLLLYALQTVSSNLPRTNFQPYRYEVILDPKKVHETLLGENVWEDKDFADVEEEEDAEENQDADDPRPNFTPRTADEAQNQAEINRWCEAEADRLAALGARQREAERQVELREEQLYNEREEAREAAEEREAQRQRTLNRVPPIETPAATVTPTGSAVLPAKITPPPNKRPSAKVNLDEVRKKVTAEIRKALPEIAAAVSSREKSRRENGRSSG
jgi:hypothetical protein